MRRLRDGRPGEHAEEQRPRRSQPRGREGVSVQVVLTRRTVALLVTLALAVPTTWAATSSPAAAAAPDGVLDVVVLGDSYSAGNGATDDAGAEQTYGPDGCRRSRVGWGEKYAATLRARGQAVRLQNHACSGGVAADLTSPRAMDTASRTTATPAGVTTQAQADAYLAATDPCNTRRFPDEESWTYRTTAVTPVLLTYDCTRQLRRQADVVSPGTDLVLLTMGGNDAGFSAIVQSCFVPLVRTADGCRGKVEAARALLPSIQQRLVAGLTALRAHGLREDARIVQLGYPWLQVDNGYTLPGATPGAPSYPAGAEVRALMTQGNAAIAAVVPSVNAGRPGQMSFLDGVPQAFSGHEPDATAPTGNPARWVDQVGDGATAENWYHPNRFGQTAYAALLAAGGTSGATSDAVTAGLGVRVKPRRVRPGARARAVVRVSVSTGARPRGRLVVQALPSGRVLATKTVRPRDKGRAVVRFKLRGRRTDRVEVTYDDVAAPPVSVVRRVRR